MTATINTTTHDGEPSDSSRVAIMDGSDAGAACVRCGSETDQRIVLVTATGACRNSRAVCSSCRHSRHRDDNLALKLLNSQNGARRTGG